MRTSRDSVHVGLNGMLLGKPAGNGLGSLAAAQPFDDLAVMAVPADGVKNDPLPVVQVLETLGLFLKVGCSNGDFLVQGLQASVVSSKVGDLFKQRLLVDLGVRLVTTGKTSQATAGADIGRMAITLSGASKIFVSPYGQLRNAST
ncbi:MAG: hypothetical protein Q9216_005688 [Gyalolechia sp. 2 TL-2023]